MQQMDIEKWLLWTAAHQTLMYAIKHKSNVKKGQCPLDLTVWVWRGLPLVSILQGPEESDAQSP